MADFNRVVVADRTRGEGNVHLAVHPFKSERIVMMLRKGWYEEYEGYEMPPYQKALADLFWDRIPGLHTLFFANGGVTIHHEHVFTDGEIFEAAKEIIVPVLEQNLMLSEVSDDDLST